MSSAYAHSLSIVVGFPMFSPCIDWSQFTFLIKGSMHSMNKEHDIAVFKNLTFWGTRFRESTSFVEKTPNCQKMTFHLFLFFFWFVKKKKIQKQKNGLKQQKIISKSFWVPNLKHLRAGWNTQQTATISDWTISSQNGFHKLFYRLVPKIYTRLVEIEQLCAMIWNTLIGLTVFG